MLSSMAHPLHMLLFLTVNAKKHLKIGIHDSKQTRCIRSCSTNTVITKMKKFLHILWNAPILKYTGTKIKNNIKRLVKKLLQCQVGFVKRVAPGPFLSVYSNRLSPRPQVSTVFHSNFERYFKQQQKRSLKHSGCEPLNTPWARS